MNKKKVVITGATGLLGTHLILTKPKSVEVIGTVHHYKKTLARTGVKYIDLEIKNKEDVLKKITQANPDIIFHAAAHSSVDFCEKNKREATATNVRGTKNVVEAAKKVEAHLFFCSTNMTYDGLEPPFDEQSPQNPQTHYGITKIRAEEAIRKSGIDYTIIRLMTMYGWNWQPKRKNMISMAHQKLAKGENLWMTNDVWNNLLYVKQAAKFFWKLSSAPKLQSQDTFNIAGKECLNRYQATMELCRVYKFDQSLVTQVSSSYFSGQETPRSPNTCFSTLKAQKRFSFKPLSMNLGLKDMKNNQLPSS